MNYEKLRIDNKIKKVIYKFGELFTTGVIFAVIASLLTTSIMSHLEAKKEMKTKIDSISNIYIGSSKSWADEKLGFPQFMGQKGEYLLCAYISEYYVVQIAFDSALSAQGYLITALENDDNINIEIQDLTIMLNDDLVLGKFSYYDFPDAPEHIWGFISNGNAREFYSETYYYMSMGNYYNYHIAFFDFGIQKTPNCWGSTKDAGIDDEVTPTTRTTGQIITDRHNCYPNTYGVSAQGIDMEELLFSYDWFNSQQLRNKAWQ